MAKTIFTNLNVLESGKGGLNQIFTNKQDMGQVNNTLGNVNKQFGDGKAGTTIVNSSKSENNSFKSGVDKGVKTTVDGPNKAQSMADQNSKVDKKAKDKSPLKNDIKSEQKPWMTETDTGGKTEVKNTKDYKGDVKHTKEPAKRDSDKQEQVDYVEKENNRSTDKQKVKEHDHENRNKYKPQPLKNTIGKGPTVIDNPVHASVKDYNMKSPQNPNPEMYPGATNPTGQAPTPSFPKNNVTKMVSGMKQPNTARPSFKLPRG